MTAKFEKFEAALRALCIEHGVTLSVSGYGGMQVWDLDPADGPIYSQGFEDRTKGGVTYAVNNRKAVRQLDGSILIIDPSGDHPPAHPDGTPIIPGEYPLGIIAS